MVALVCSTFKATLKPWGELQVVYEGQYLVSLVRGDVYRKKKKNATKYRRTRKYSNHKETRGNAV